MSTYIELAYIPEYGCYVLGDSDGYISVLTSIETMTLGMVTDPPRDMRAIWAPRPEATVLTLEGVVKSVVLSKVKFDISQQIFTLWATFEEEERLWVVHLPPDCGMVRPAKGKMHIFQAQ